MVTKAKNEKLTVSTQAEFDVNQTIKSEIEAAIQDTINKCSTQYFRSIDVDVEIKIK